MLREQDDIQEAELEALREPHKSIFVEPPPLREQIAMIIWSPSGLTYEERLDQILTLFKEQIDKLEVIGEQDIRLNCLGEGLYWVGEICETAADKAPVLMPQFKNVAQAQLNHDKTKLYEVLE